MKFYILYLVVLLDNLSAEDAADRPVIKASNGDLIIDPADGRNVYIRTRGHNSKVFVGDIDLTQALLGNLTRHDQSGASDVGEDTETVTNYISGPGGILSRLNRLESRAVFSPDNRSDASLRYRISALSRQVNTLKYQVQQILNGNDCSSGPCKNGGTCQRVGGGYFCQCPPNWEGKDCDVDVNECQNFAGTDLGCQNGATCINRQGSYECFCPFGWFGIHCTRRAKDCSGGDAEMCGHGTCVSIKTGTGIMCICHQGWKNSATDQACMTDVDECTESTTGSHCSVNPPVECINLPGSFRCGPCPKGYQGDGYKCFDIDECAVNNGGCSNNPLVACHNTIGSRMCGACPAGYQGDGTTCSWRGTCSFNRGGCHPSATCVENLAISAQFVQCICPPGMAGDGVGIGGCYIPSRNSNATDCSGNPCGRHGQCHQLERGITCICNEGFTGLYCDTARDYCAENPCKNGGICRSDNSAAGYRCECTAMYSGDNCQNRARTCGAVLESQEGSILYPLPNTSSTYNHNSRCVWLIQTANNKVLNVTFSKFNLESSRTCTFDFLQIHDGRSSASQIIGRFCGNNLPKGGNIISSHNTLYFWFHSDQTVSREGFALHWTSIDPVCGGEVDATTHGTISSPGSPGSYPPNRNCNWHLLTDLGKRIQLHFFRIGLEAHPNCSFDYLEIFDGAQVTDPLLKRYCNTSQPAPLQSAGSELLMHFHSDEFNSGEGFQVSYAPIEGVPGCGGTYTQEKGEITSPSFNGRYLHDLLCDYKIQVAPGTKIKVKFLKFELERSVMCRFDHLSIYDGPDSNAKLIGKFCGRNIPTNFVSSSNTVFMQFKTDSTMAHGGFKISFEIICQESLTSDTGILKSPGYPNLYPSDRICEYFISTTPGKAIRLSFQHFDVEDNTYYDCEYDNLQIRDGPNINSTLLGRYCASNLPPTQTSTHNYMYLRFTSDFSLSGTGFLANYSTVDVTCGGIYTAASGVISHPIDEQGRYDNEQECTWIIIAPVGHDIQIMWTRFNLERLTKSCWNDYVQFTEKQEDEEIDYGRFCGEQFPPAITTVSNELKVYFKSDSSIRSNGFSLTYTTSDRKTRCGGNYMMAHGYINSPGWPNRYLSNKDCVWQITVPNGQQIQLNISTFDVEFSRTCSEDFLEIRNGPTETSPLIGKFCGSTIPKKITSHGNTLYLHFKSDSYVEAPGFQIEWDGTATGCGGTLTSSSGSITSPNYPQPYSKDGECFWRIIVSVGSVVSISFLDIDMENTIECSADYVEVYDGKDASATVLGKYCIMDHRSSIIKSSTNQVFIKFRSDISIEGKGFSLNYFTDCNTEVTGYSGVIESPDFPNEYPHNMNCLWTVRAPKGNKINATFTHFDLPQRTFNFYRRPYSWERPIYGLQSRITSFNGSVSLRQTDKCNNDYVQIKDGKDSDFTNKYCGNKIPAKFVSRDSTMNLKFISGPYLRRQGFRLEWIVDGCGGVIRKSFGIITPPKHRRGIDEPTECEWIIETPLGSSVEMYIWGLSERESPDCSVDSIEFHDGIDAKAHLLMKVCHQPDTHYQIVSTSNLLFMRFVSTSGYAGIQFTAQFTAIQGKCGGLIVGTSGSVTSPNYPKNYGTNSNCLWVIRVPENYRVQLDITDLDLFSYTGDDICIDRLELYEGEYEIKSNYSRKYCDNILSDSVRTFTSKSNVISIWFKSGEHGAKGFKAKFLVACGSEIITKTEGILSSSLSAAVHSGNQCTWVILAEKPEQKISLTFTHMTLKTSNDGNTSRPCSTDFLKVYNGNDVEAPIIAEYCSRRVPPTIVSQGNAITVQLGSYVGSVTGEFSVHYSVLDTACGGTLTSEEGTLASPGYPGTYSMSTDCIWNIATSPGNKASLTFEKFDLESSMNCNEDYVEVREDAGDGKVLGVYCGNHVPALGIVGEKLYIKFHSDNIGSAPGFLAHYELVHDNEIVGNPSGQLASPLYPLYYRGSGEFSWRITTNASNYFGITITRLEIDVRGSACYNHLSVYDGYDHTAPLLKQYCGLLNPDEQEIRATSNMVFVKLFLDETNARSLFFLTWLTVEKKPKDQGVISSKGCGTNQTVVIDPYTSVDIKSPKYPSSYDDNLDCNWVFETALGRHLKVVFSVFRLEQSEGCILDYVRIYSGSGGTNDWHPIAEQLCLSSVSNNHSLETTNLMKIVFHSDVYGAGLGNTGFQGTVYSMCGGILTEPSGVIESTASDRLLFQTHFISCNWTVKVKPRRTIGLRFERLQITSPTSPCTNYVLLKNGASMESPSLGSKYCGDKIPEVNSLETSGNTLFVTYTSSSFHGLDGFRLHYEEKSIDCGSSSKLDSIEAFMVISSLNYPEPPFPYSECVWTVMGPPGEVLKLEFIERFDLSNDWRSGTECDEEYVEVRDGASESSPLIGRFCDDKKLSTIKTKSNAIYVKFITLLLTPNDGFKANISIDVCGGSLRSSFREVFTVTSPGYPKYPNLPIGTVCEWRLTGTSGTSLWVNILDLSLPESEVSCAIKVVVEDVLPTNRSNLVQKTFCGGEDYVLEPIKSISNEVIVKLYVQKPTMGIDTSRYKGFRLNFNSTDGRCGGKVTAPSGYIETQGYPHRMTTLYCIWEIEIPDPSRRIRLEFLDLDVGLGDKHENMITIYNDDGYRAPLAYIPSVGWDVNQKVYESSGNTMTINVQSRFNTNHRGFRARYSSDEPAMCGGLMSAESGSVTSPPATINQTYYCQWRLALGNTDDVHSNAVSLGSNMTIYININMTSSGTSTRSYCRYSIPVISVKPASEDNDEINFFRDNCNTGVEVLRVPLRSLKLSAFKSKGYTIDFVVTWKIQSCGGSIEVGNDDIDILNLPSDHKGSLDCAWYVKVRPERIVQLELEGTFSSSCSEEFITIYEGMYKNSPSIAEYCQTKPYTLLPLHLKSFYIQYHSDFYSNATNVKFKTSVENAKSCGGTISGLDRLLMTPNYPKSYSENQECTWDISTSLGNKISLEFQGRFHIEDTVNCTKDYVIVFDWNNDEYEQVARLCGRHKPENINSTANRMKVVFRSDSGINADGFQASWKPVCGGSYQATEKEQYIYSPNYPQVYDRNLDCSYKILAPAKKVIVKFEHFSLESGYGGDCEYDNITIKPDDEWRDTGLDRYCGEQSPPTRYYSGGVTIHFHSDSSIQSKGFKIIYKLKTCGGNIRNSTVISSGEEDGLYDTNMNCIWNITAPANKNVVVRFAHFEIEGTSECTMNYVAIYNGSKIEENQRLAMLCGNLNRTLPVFRSNGSSMIVQFVTDYAVNNNGFKAEVYFSYGQSVGCGGEIDMTNTNQVTLKSPIFRGAFVYEKYLDCHWTVKAAVDKVIKIEFTRFNIAPCSNVNQTALGFSNCSCDAVTLRDGANPTSTIIDRYCGHNLPPKVTSTSNFMLVMLYTDGEVESAGFEAKLTVGYSQCGKQHFISSTSVQHIKSPQYDEGVLSRGLHCVYHVKHGGNGRLFIKIKKLDLEPPSRDTHVCTFDKLEISGYRLHHNTSVGKDLIMRGNSLFRDYLEDYFTDMTSPQTLYTLCGKAESFEIYVYDEVTLRLTTAAGELEGTHIGFDIEVSQTNDCIRNYTGLQGRIQSPSSDNSSDCQTLITVPQGYTVSVYFIHSISYWADDEGDYIEIRDGDKSDSTLLKRSSTVNTIENAFSTGRNLLISRHGKESYPMQYDLNYIATDKGRGCGGKLHAVIGIVTSPMYPEPYRQIKSCEFILESLPESRLKLRFKTFDLGARATCDHVYVELVDRLGTSIRSYCSDDNPADFTSEDNYVKIVYHTTMNTGGPGWIAQFVSFYGNKP